MKNNSLKNSKIYIIGGVCAIMAAACVFLTIDCATSSSEIADLQTKEGSLIAEQQVLQQSLVETMSNGRLQDKSTTLGFSKVSNLVYIGGSDVASSHTVARLP